MILDQVNSGMLTVRMAVMYLLLGGERQMALLLKDAHVIDPQNGI